MGLFQAVTQRPGEAVHTFEVPPTPWVIGRAAGAGLPLSGPGIFDHHLTLRTVLGEGVIVEVGEGALARVDGQEFRRHRLRNGDVIHLGNFGIRFVLSPVRRKPLGGWTVLFWALLASVLSAQAAMLLRLANP